MTAPPWSASPWSSAARSGRGRAHLAELGVHDVERDEVDDLVLDVCLMLADVAAAWRADGGASPWQWAWHRVRGVVSGWVGQHADTLDDSRARVGGPARGPGRMRRTSRSLRPTRHPRPRRGRRAGGAGVGGQHPGSGHPARGRRPGRAGRPVARGDRGRRPGHEPRGRAPGGLPDTPPAPAPRRGRRALFAALADLPSLPRPTAGRGCSRPGRSGTRCRRRCSRRPSRVTHQ